MVYPTDIAKEVLRRRDMREVFTFTIDPADAKDFDDALSFERVESQESGVESYQIGVHIADVSHYVRVGSKEEETMLMDTYKAVIANKSKDTETLYKSINQLSDAGVALLDKKAKIGWTSHGHTASPVPIFSIGVGAERFSGWHDNTELVPLIRQAVEQQ